MVPRARLNYAEHAYRDRDADTVAIRHASELRPLRETTWGSSTSDRRVGRGAPRAGIGPGDRVVAYVPNIVEAVVAFHACASLGAVWSSCSPDFGVRSVVDRFAQIEPRILLAVDGYRYGGATTTGSTSSGRSRRRCRASSGPSSWATSTTEPRSGRLGHATGWDDFLAEGEDEALAFAQVAFDHPLWVLYSSGTTGLPKAIVHGHGGILLEHLKTLHLHVDLQARGPPLLVHDDRLDDVELRRRRAADATRRSSSTTATPGTPTSACSGTSPRRRAITCFGTSASYVAACVQGRRRATRGP